VAEKKMAIIATKGTLDWAYPPFILASTAAALNWEVQIFFTFYGLELLLKKPGLKISSLGNPGMPMKMGPVTIPMPVLMQALPGIEGMMTMMMKQKMKAKGIATIEELREICKEGGVKMIGCQMTVDLFDFAPNEFIDGIEFGGAAMFLAFAGEADVTLYI